MQLVLCHWLEGQLVGIAAHPEYHLLGVGAESHLNYIALRELECLHGKGATFMLLFWSARRCDQLPPFELIMYAP